MHDPGHRVENAGHGGGPRRQPIGHGANHRGRIGLDARIGDHQRQVRDLQRDDLARLAVVVKQRPAADRRRQVEAGAGLLHAEDRLQPQVEQVTCREAHPADVRQREQRAGHRRRRAAQPELARKVAAGGNRDVALQAKPVAPDRQRALDEARAARPRLPARQRVRHAPGDALDAHVRRVDGERPAAGRASSQRQVQARIDSRHQAGARVDDGVLAQQHGLARRRDVGGPDCGVSHPTLLKNAATECKSFGASGQ